MSNHKNGDSRRQVGHKTTLCLPGRSGAVGALVVKVKDSNVWYRTADGEVWRSDRKLGKMFKEAKA